MNRNIDRNIREKLSSANYSEVPLFLSMNIASFKFGDPIDNLLNLFNRRISTLKVTLPNMKSKFYYMIQYIMTVLLPVDINLLVSKLGFINLNDSVDTFYNLLYYIHGTQSPFANNLTKEEIAYISGLSSSDLITLFPKTYDHAKDKSSLLYAAISGNAIPEVIISRERYQQVIRYPPKIIWQLAFLRYNVVKIETSESEYTETETFVVYDVHNPYQLVALNPLVKFDPVNLLKDNIENIFLFANETNVDNLIDQYGIIIPNVNDSRLTQFLEQISDYQNVFTRDPNIILPSTVNNTIITLLKQFTTRELVERYNPINEWNTRQQLFNLIIERLNKDSLTSKSGIEPIINNLLIMSENRYMELSPSGKVLANYNPNNGSIKIIDAKTKVEISDLGQYSIGSSEGEIITSLRFSGENNLRLLDNQGNILESIYLKPNYQYMNKLEIFNPVEIARIRGFPL